VKRQKKHSVMYDALKALRKANREREIELYGKTIHYDKIVSNKKKYTRKVKHKAFGIMP